MSTRQAFEYALLRVVPRVDRGECFNGGVVLYAKGARFLGAAVELDARRLHALDPAADPAAISRVLGHHVAVCAATAEVSDADRLDCFRWLTAPRSTVVQPGPVHTGLTIDPAAELDRLFRTLVLPLRPQPSARGDAAQA